jgi:riboflavin biosynthesis pyrimidine reductase
MGFTSVLCEGGLTLARSLAEADLVDEWLTVLAPVVIGNMPISKSLRASAISEKCFPVEGDMFFRARLDRV